MESIFIGLNFRPFRIFQTIVFISSSFVFLYYLRAILTNNGLFEEQIFISYFGINLCVLSLTLLSFLFQLEKFYLVSISFLLLITIHLVIFSDISVSTIPIALTLIMLVLLFSALNSKGAFCFSIISFTSLKASKIIMMETRFDTSLEELIVEDIFLIISILCLFSIKRSFEVTSNRFKHISDIYIHKIHDARNYLEFLRDANVQQVNSIRNYLYKVLAEDIDLNEACVANLRACTEEAVIACGRIINSSNIQCKITHLGTIEEVVFNPNLLERVIMNIILNSIRNLNESMMKEKIINIEIIGDKQFISIYIYDNYPCNQKYIKLGTGLTFVKESVTSFGGKFHIGKTSIGSFLFLLHLKPTSTGLHK